MCNLKFSPFTIFVSDNHLINIFSLNSNIQRTGFLDKLKVRLQKLISFKFSQFLVMKSLVYFVSSSGNRLIYFLSYKIYLKNQKIYIIQSKQKLMKDRCWKQLKNQLCPREKWVKDTEQTSCQCCFKQFKVFVRRRHHCRFCGNLFCSDCSDYFINGNYIDEKKEKYIRHCEFCHKKIEKFIREWTKEPEVYDDHKNDVASDHDMSEEEEDTDDIHFNLNKIFEESEKNTCELCQKLDDEVNKKLEVAADYLCDKYSLDKKNWKSKLVELSIKGALQTKMQSLVSEGSAQNAMDIARKVKIKTLSTEKGQGVKAIVKGIVLDKNPNKQKNTHLSHPKVLVIENSIDLDTLNSFIKFEELIKNDKVIMTKILEKIVKLNPDIIFVENNVHVFALEYLQSKSIMVIYRLKQKQLEMIKQITGIKKSIKKLWMLEKYKNSHAILGHCDKIYFKTIKEGQALMFIEAEMGIRTIIIGQHLDEDVTNLKKSIQILLRLARQMNLEKYIVLTDKQIKQSFQMSRKDLFLYPSLDQLNNSFYASIETFLFYQQLLFTKILYYQVKLSQGTKNFQQYAHKTGKSTYKEICGKVDFLSKKIYSSSDMSLGAYILLAAANYERPCKKCETNHIQEYYLNNHMITIEADRKAKSVLSASFIEEYPNEEEVTLEKLKTHLNKQKELIVIETHVYCNMCGCNVGKEGTKIGKFYLSNSFHSFLYCLVEAYIRETDRLLMVEQKEQLESSTSESRKLIRRKLSIDKCLHQQLMRVYQYSGIAIKMFVQPIKTSINDYINLETKFSTDNIRTKQKNFIRRLFEIQLKQITAVIEKIKYQLSALPFPVMTGSLSVSLSLKTIGVYEQSIKLRQILQKCLSELEEIEKQFEEEIEISVKYDWTILNRRILKVQSILPLMIAVIDEIERSLRRKKQDEGRQSNRKSGSNDIESQILVENQELSYSKAETLENISIANLSAVANQSQSYIDEENREYLKNQAKKRFPRVQGVFLHFFTCYVNDPVSLLSCAINSNQLKKVCEDEAVSNSAEINFKMYMYRRVKTEWPLRVQFDNLYREIFGQEIVDKNEPFDFTVYFNKQFEQLRNNEGIDNELYVRGLCSCKSWDSSGGKSNSLFAKAENDLLVVKVINEKQFEEFLKFAKDYVEYMKASKIVGRQTLLAKIYGIYSVVAKGKTYKCVVMQNIFFGLSTISKVYDLKGSQVNRLTMPPENNRSYTGQDTNFKIDKDGEPYILKAAEYEKFVKVIEDDCQFLKEHAVIDYSLLAIESKDILRLGIIDYMRPYQLMQKLQTFYKQFKSGRDPTVIPPNSYAERFIAAMKKYFIKVE